MKKSTITSNTNCIILLVTLVLLFFIIPSKNIYAEESGIIFEKGSYSFLISDGYGSISVETDEGVDEWISSDKSVVDIDWAGWDYVELELVGVGTAEITAKGYDGSIASCTVTVTAPEIIVSKKKITCSITDEEEYFDITSGYGLSFSSSDTSVLTIFDDSDDESCHIELVAPGVATVTITDCAGKTEMVEVTVTKPEWNINKTVINAVLSDYGEDLIIETEDWYNEFSWKSSDENIVIVYDDDDSAELEYVSVGTAIITVTDKYGQIATCTVNVAPDPLILNCTSIKYDSYRKNYSDVIEVKGYVENIITSAKTSNKEVATVKAYKDGDTYALINPKGVGTATITITDQYGQKATVKVTVTQKYIDEAKYLEELEWSEIDEVIYGDTSIYCWCDISASIYTTIDGVKYKASVNEDGDYIIKGIPKLSAGTKITIYFQKGEAKAKETVTVQAKQAKYFDASIKAQTYTGSALKPAVTIKDGKTMLKKGTDYTVTYSNNKNVGKGKATISFKGNYKGAKAAYFTIKPKGTSISKTTAEKKGFTVKWTKQATQTTGYQIQYSLYKSFSSKKTATIKSSSVTSKTVTGLKGSKTYYIKIRTYKIVDGEKYYSAWSDVKTVKTKK
ncbi:fibronectin type III domain-containing protein [Ruminococcus sp.]|uniref:fibronectin type III domain-containing protein n=1 Tax=Ruminococcus sp. TaxID=41978 RepID=UPI002588D173|nr:fibronectin type III domain-containing protein [Ruminococcus sp.]MCR5020861.1 fibronectin type III domain-containing protein [Ruminococcus sp.]